jgi:hypothetical protein
MFCGSDKCRRENENAQKKSFFYLLGEVDVRNQGKSVVKLASWKNRSAGTKL